VVFFFFNPDKNYKPQQCTLRTVTRYYLWLRSFEQSTCANPAQQLHHVVYLVLRGMLM